MTDDLTKEHDGAFLESLEWLEEWKRFEKAVERATNDKDITRLLAMKHEINRAIEKVKASYDDG